MHTPARAYVPGCCLVTGERDGADQIVPAIGRGNEERPYVQRPCSCVTKTRCAPYSVSIHPRERKRPCAENVETANLSRNFQSICSRILRLLCGRCCTWRESRWQPANCQGRQRQALPQRRRRARKCRQVSFITAARHHCRSCALQLKHLTRYLTRCLFPKIGARRHLHSGYVRDNTRARGAVLAECAKTSVSPCNN